MQVDPARIDVIAPNLKRRLSGVTATVFGLVPVQARDVAIAATGPAIPDDIPQIALPKLLTMPRSGPSGARVWHARRNTEMIAGLALRLLGKRLKLVFTTASQRNHTRLTRALIARMDAIVAVSARSAAYLERDALINLHGIDTTRFRPAEDRAALRRRLGLDPDAILIGCYGRVRAKKGAGDFVSAVERILPEHPKAAAILMGGVSPGQESFHAALASRIRGLGFGDRLRLLPEVPVGDMPDWYAALDLYVAPQRWEGFGLTVLEAMGAGVPVVATRVGAFAETVRDGETGYLVDPQDIDAMTRAIDRVISDPDRQAAMSEAARAHVTRDFDITREAAALNALYRRLLEEG